MGEVAARLRAVELGPEAWEPFGWLPVDDTDPRDGTHTLEFAWSDAHLNVIGHDLTEIPRGPGGLRCEVMYRHETHTQALMSLDSAAVIAVAPAAVGFSHAGDVEQVRAFLLAPLQTVVLHRGTWHWGPFPVGAPRVRLLNVQGRRYLEDNASVDLAGRDMAVEIATGA